LTGWIEGQTLHVGFQALEHRGQLLHQLPGHGLTANQCQSSLKGDHFHRRKWYLATWYLIQLIGPSIFGW
jgi:hypothetical protein